jgi:predicted enzyme related to lactoylglutathione lyase
MFAEINHIAIISHQWYLLVKFYESLFGLRSPGDSPSVSAQSVGDGNVGLQILPRRDGYIGGIDHFGMVVDDLGEVEKRLRKHAGSNIVKRPSSRPFAAYSANDANGNHFDLVERSGDNLKEVYAKGAWQQDRTFNKYAIRTIEPERIADFYSEVFELRPMKTASNEGGFAVTDGTMTIAIMPWNMEHFAGMAIKRPGPEHIGFKVEDIEAFKTDAAKLAGENPYLAPVPLGGSVESDVRRRFLEGSATGKMQIADPDGVWIDVSDS